jgi:hypothetical protein
MNPFRRIVEYLRRPPQSHAPVGFDDQAFWRSPPDPFRAQWSSIRRIMGFKVDCFSVDQIRMEFSFEPGNFVVVTEDSPGFRQLMEEAERRFPSLEGWFQKIFLPPFAPCITLLYEAPGQEIQRGE